MSSGPLAITRITRNLILNTYLFLGGNRNWLDFEYDWKKKRNESIRELSFPFPYRAHQKELAAMTYHTIANQKKLFIEAPTGVGKTITTIFPALKAMARHRQTGRHLAPFQTDIPDVFPHKGE